MRYPFAAALRALAVAALGLQTAYAVGLRVSPGGALIQGIEPGQKAELAVPITVMSDDPEPKAIVFAAVAPRREKMKVPAGYNDIPDLAWVSFTKPEVEVPAKGHAAVKMILSIPQGKEYHNQHWSVAVAVRSKPVAGQMLALGLYPRFEIETSPARIKGGLFRGPKPPAGDLAFAPSLEEAAGVVPGGPARRLSLELWNNTAKPWRGEATIVAGAEAAKKERLDLSGGFEWLPDPAWLKLDTAKLEVGANRAADVELDVAIPSGAANRGRSWEAILLVKGDEGLAAFARIRVKATATAPQH
jgi:hypothetical protein